MTALGHTAVASLVRGHPLLRLAWGFVSHAMLDVTMPEYRPRDVLLTKPRTWFKPWVLLQIAGVLFFGLSTGDWWAFVYGMLPDAIEALYVGYMWVRYKRNVWMTGELLFPWHRPKQAKEWSYRKTILVELGLLAVVVWLYT